jgi:hypothetical protein
MPLLPLTTPPCYRIADRCFKVCIEIHAVVAFIATIEHGVANCGVVPVSDKGNERIQ